VGKRGIPGFPTAKEMSVTSRWFVLLPAMIGSALYCACSIEGTPRGVSELEVHVIHSDSCVDCQRINFDSHLLGHFSIWVRAEPDLVLSSEDITSIVPVQLTAVSSMDSKDVVWTASLQFTPDAARRLRNLRGRLVEDGRILISMGDQPLSVGYAGELGQMLSIGEFSSLDELRETLDRYGDILDEASEKVDLLSPEEIEEQRKTDILLEKLDRMEHTTEEIRKLAEEGTISREEMIRRLIDLDREAAED
jgi:hypothetical protein